MFKTFTSIHEGKQLLFNYMNDKSESTLEKEDDGLRNIKFGIFVYIPRRKLDLKQREVIPKFKITRSTISLIEHGQKRMIGNNQARLLEFFGYTLGTAYSIIENKEKMYEFLLNFQNKCGIKPEKIEYLFQYWSETPPLEDKNPILKLFPRGVLK